MNWNPIATRRQLGHARQVANEHRVRAQELQQALAYLTETVEALPVAISYRPSTQAKVLIQNGNTVPVRIPALADPGAPVVLAVRQARKVLA